MPGPTNSTQLRLNRLLPVFDDGTRGSLVVSQVSAGRKNRLWFEADGTDGSLQWDAETNEQLWLGHRDRPNEVHWREPGPVSDHPGGHPEGFPDTFKQLYRAVYRAVESGKMPAEPDFPTFRDGHAAVVVCEAIAESARTRTWVAVPSRAAQPLPANRSRRTPRRARPRRARAAGSRARRARSRPSSRRPTTPACQPRVERWMPRLRVASGSERR